MPSDYATKLAPTTSHSDFFLKLDDIKGESQDDKHKGEIDLVGFSFGAIQPGAAGSIGSGSGAGKVSFSHFVLTKLMDSASPKLMLACASGQHFKEATLTCAKAGGSKVEYLKIKLEQVLISGYETSGGTAEPEEMSGKYTLPVDVIKLNYAKIQFNYVAQNKDGTAGANTMTGWDLQKNVKV